MSARECGTVERTRGTGDLLGKDPAPLRRKKRNPACLKTGALNKPHVIPWCARVTSAPASSSMTHAPSILPVRSLSSTTLRPCP